MGFRFEVLEKVQVVGQGGTWEDRMVVCVRRQVERVCRDSMEFRRRDSDISRNEIMVRVQGQN
jgi:hypothetical protein